MTAGTDAERITELEEQNRRLGRLLNQQNAPGELRHRLRSTLALLRAVVRRSANTKRDLPSYVAHLEDRLDAITRAQALADQHGAVDLHALLTDELFAYGMAEGERLLLSGPTVKLQPRAGQVFALAVHELAVNAIEHGALGAGNGRIDVSWSTADASPAPVLFFKWTEHGMVPGGALPSQGFGTEVLTRMLEYELNAHTELGFREEGLHCTISLPLSKQIFQVDPDDHHSLRRVGEG